MQLCRFGIQCIRSRRRAECNLLLNHHQKNKLNTKLLYTCVNGFYPRFYITLHFYGFWRQGTTLLFTSQSRIFINIDKLRFRTQSNDIKDPENPEEHQNLLDFYTIQVNERNHLQLKMFKVWIRTKYLLESEVENEINIICVKKWKYSGFERIKMQWKFDLCSFLTSSSF